MSPTARVAGEPLLEEFPFSRRVRDAFGEIGIPMEPWEALALARSEGGHLRQELDRIASLRRAGRSARPGFLLLESLSRHRETLGRLARGLRVLLTRRGGTAVRPDVLEAALALALVDPARRADAARWIDGETFDPAPLFELAARCCADASTLELPPGVDRELFSDLVETRRFLEALAGQDRRIEPWEVFCLAVQDRSSVAQAAERLRSAEGQAAAADGNAVTVRLLERLLDVRFRWTPFVRRLAAFVRRLPIGRYGRETIDLALAFTLASSEGRDRARQWLEDPVHFRREAAIRLEGVIGRAQKYLSALRAVGAA